MPDSYLAVCAIYRDEAPFLREWIEFHRLVGVDRFFLYDNGSVDDGRSVLAPYEDEGLVVRQEWLRFPGWRSAYSDCLSEYGAGGSIFQHEANPPKPVDTGSNYHPEEYENLTHEAYWAALATRVPLLPDASAHVRARSSGVSIVR